MKTYELAGLVIGGSKFERLGDIPGAGVCRAEFASSRLIVGLFLLANGSGLL